MNEEITKVENEDSVNETAETKPVELKKDLIEKAADWHHAKRLRKAEKKAAKEAAKAEKKAAKSENKTEGGKINAKVAIGAAVLGAAVVGVGNMLLRAGSHEEEPTEEEAPVQENVPVTEENVEE